MYGGTITVEPGVIVKFQRAMSRLVLMGGSLDVQGTSGNKVYFTSVNDFGGTPYAGDWDTISIGSGPRLRLPMPWCVMEDMTTGRSSEMISNSGGTLTLADCEIATGTKYGIKQPSGTNQGHRFGYSSHDLCLERGVLSLGSAAGPAWPPINPASAVRTW